jgi:hypothetical protein
LLYLLLWCVIIMKFEKEGVLTSGYYNDMEARFPVFIDGDSISDVVKGLLEKKGMDSNFCYEPLGSDEDVKNPLKGKKVRLTLEILD